MIRKMVQIRSADADENLLRITKSVELAFDRKKDAREARDELAKFTEGTAIRDINDFFRYCNNLEKQRVRLDWNNFTVRRQLAETAYDKLKDTLNFTLDNMQELASPTLHTQPMMRHQKETDRLVESKQDEILKIKQELDGRDPDFHHLLESVEKLKPRWGEHIETVAGMVLRDDKFDGELCRIADLIVEICSGEGMFSAGRTLNVLGRENVERDEVHYTLYFRFPGWSVWALPLIAHDFWHAEVSKLDALRGNIFKVAKAESIWKKALVQNCLADTFATHVMGPAYVFACVLLILNFDSPEDRVRAEIIFAAARESVDGWQGWEGPLGELEQCWTDSIGKPDAPTCLLAKPKDSCDLVNEIISSFSKDGRIQAGASTTAKCKLADGGESCPMTNTDVIQSMQLALLAHLVGYKISYPAEAVTLFSDKLKNLLTDEEPGGPESYPDKLDLRHVLNAAWQQRWEDPDPGTVSLVGERAIQLCKSFIPKKETTRQEPDLSSRIGGH